eukprot:XP_001705002.1 Hypothetical protein GL50803_9335 [Giardia lamblia ATCC 50803]
MIYFILDWQYASRVHGIIVEREELCPGSVLSLLRASHERRDKGGGT